MSKAPRITGQALVKALINGGWELKRISGSAHILAKGAARVSVHVHARDILKQGTLNGMLRDAGMTVEDLEELL
ncbi:MAG: type II toxin-antitoxin system HicA family toxin [Chloroflexota bacterium]|nr:type II toxin-antitoxin system HicA family toxin [Chloroflexota bacterium]